jgi:hypothetical protein
MEPRAPPPNSAAAPRALIPPAVAPPFALPVIPTDIAPPDFVPCAAVSPAAAPLAPPIPTVVALCEDQALLQAATAAVGRQAMLVSSPTQDRFVDQLVANGAEIAVIDMAIAPNMTTSFLISLRLQFPQLRLLVVGTVELHEELRGQIADGTVFRFALKPVSAQRLKLLLAAALRARPPQTPPSAGETVDESGKALATIARGARPRWLWPLLLCCTTLGAMVAGWYASSLASQWHLLP